MTKSLLLCLMVASLAGCADTLECGPGTHAEGEACVASLSPQCGAGTRLEAGSCVPDEGGGAMCGEGTYLLNGTCVPDIARHGNAGRFYDVNLTSPANIVGISNGSLHQSFMTGENLLFVGADRALDGSLRIFGGVGTRAEDRSYDLERGTAFETAATMDGNVMSTAPFTLSMLAFGATDPIVLVDAVITDGVLDAPEGIELVESGQLDGVLTPEHAMAVYIESANLPLFDLLYAVSAEPDVDFDGDGTKESWAFGLSFVTETCWLF